MLVVYEHGESVCCHKVRIALAEKGVPYESRNIALEAGQQTTPKFLKVNPKGVVPVIVHNGKTITDSTIILEYLDDCFPSPALMPTDPYLRARRRFWARWIDDEMHVPHIAAISFIIAFNKAFRKELDTQEKLDDYISQIPLESNRKTLEEGFASGIDSDLMRKALKAYDYFLEEIDKQLAETLWLAGDEFSLADIDVVPYVWRLNNLQMSGMWADKPRIQDWLDRVTSRSSFKKGVIDGALPAWIALMEAAGKQAWPIISEIREQ